MDNNELMHYGVVGMRWGKRKLNNYNDKINRSATRSDRANQKAIRKYQPKIDKIQSNIDKTTGKYVKRAENKITKAGNSRGNAKGALDYGNAKKQKYEDNAYNYITNRSEY